MDHLGRFQPRLWSAIVHRAVSTIVQYPGVPGDVVLQSMRVVNPQHAREALGVLCAAGVLRATKEEAKVHPKNILAACFGQSSSGSCIVGTSNSRDVIAGGASITKTGTYGGANFDVDGQGDDCTWHFFADPVTCWEALEVVPPKVLVPAAATPSDVNISQHRHR